MSTTMLDSIMPVDWACNNINNILNMLIAYIYFLLYHLSLNNMRDPDQLEYIQHVEKNFDHVKYN